MAYGQILGLMLSAILGRTADSVKGKQGAPAMQQ